MDSAPCCGTKALLSFAGFVLLYWIAYFLQIYDDHPGIFLTICGVAAYIIGRNSRGAEIDEVQQTRADAARRTLWMVEDGKDPGPFCVYLRPFTSDGHLQAVNQGEAFGPTTVLAGRTSHFEEVLANALTGWSLVGLGEDAEFPSAGRLNVRDDVWQSTVLALAKAAQLIVMIPSSHAGTLWEAQSLSDEGLLEKCVFVMPRKPLDSYPAAKEWESACAAFSGIGLILPSYEPEGALFRMATDGAKVVRPLLMNARYLRNELALLAQGTSVVIPSG